jgi:hypothetical protein
MNELPPETPQPEQLPRFSSPRDQVLYEMSSNGWSNSTSGDVRCITGWFAKLANTEPELQEVVEAFEEEIAAAGLGSTAELLGHFLVMEDALGNVTVHEAPDAAQLEHTYQVFEEAYAPWRERQGSES